MLSVGPYYLIWSSHSPMGEVFVSEGETETRGRSLAQGHTGLGSEAVCRLRSRHLYLPSVAPLLEVAQGIVFAHFSVTSSPQGGPEHVSQSSPRDLSTARHPGPWSEKVTPGCAPHPSCQRHHLAYNQ